MVYFFGCRTGSKGHHWCRDDTQNLFNYWDELPRELWYIDGTLPPGKEQIEGQCAITRTVGFTIVSFWDRSEDSRGNSNANFAIEGNYLFDEVIEKAKQAYPTVFARFKFPLVLVQGA